ncbi:ATP-binding protein, partial [Patescibacteria group bacterium]|nr:ATP-binding protein [Patescibacteria group bacterium]
MENQVLIFTAIGVGIILLSVLVFILVKKIKYKYFLNTLKLRVLEVKLIQKFENEKKENWAQEINLSGQLISILANLKVPFSFEVAVNYLGEEIGFYVAVPSDSIQFTMRQIQGLWSDAQVEEIEDYNIFNNQGSSVGAFLRQKQNAVLPIRTFEEAQVDTFLPILSNLSKIETIGEGISLQILIKPAPSSFKKTFFGVLENLKKGKKIQDAIKVEGAGISFNDIKLALNPESDADKAKKAEEKIVIDEETIKAVEKKLSKPLFSVDIRLVVSTPSQSRSEEVLNSFMGSFDQFSAPFRNEFKFIKPRNQSNFIFKYIFREFDNNQSMILGTDELISIFHFPTSLTEIPRVKWLKSREMSPPSNLSKNGVLIGKSVFRKEEKQVFISEEDRRRHIYVVGQTGTGKSTLLKNMASSDIVNGKGVAIIDPHGDFIDDILALIPKDRHDDV